MDGEKVTHVRGEESEELPCGVSRPVRGQGSGLGSWLPRYPLETDQASKTGQWGFVN